MKIRINGFTLLELIVVIGIIGILVGVSAPNFRSFTLNSRLNVSRDLVRTELSNAFSSARSTRNLQRVYGILGENQVRTAMCEREQICTDPVDPGSCSYQYVCEEKEQVILEPGVVIRKDFQVDYIPPHGEVVLNEDENQERLVIEMQNNFEQYRGVEIRQVSGRVEPLGNDEMNAFLLNGN